MSIAGLPGESSAYDVIYRAKWDGTELSAGAAKARAELDALQKSNTAYNQQAAQDSRTAAQAANSRTAAEAQLTRSFTDEAKALELLNKQKNRGYQDPQQLLSLIQKQTTAQQLLNKAENNGRDSADQKLADIKNETTALGQKAKQVGSLAQFFDELTTSQKNAANADPFAKDTGRATANLKSYADQVESVIKGLQAAVSNDPFSTGVATKKATANVQAFADSVKRAVEDVNNSVETETNRKGGISSFFNSFNNTSKDIQKSLQGISEGAKKASQDGEGAASKLDTAWKKLKYTLDSVKTSAGNVFSGNGGGVGSGIGGLFASGAAASGAFLQVIVAAIPALTSFWGILATGVTVLPLLISLVLALGTGIIGLVASVGTLTLAAGAIVPIFVALAAAAGALYLALKPVISAIQVLQRPTSSQAQINNALKNLSPQAQQAAEAISSVVTAFKKLGQGVENSFWNKSLINSIKGLTGAVGPLNTLLNALAKILGKDVAEGLKQFENFLHSSDFRTLSAGAVTTITNLANALFNVLGIITKLAVVGQPITNMFTGGIERMTARLNDFIQTAQNNGTLTKFFDDLQNRLRLVGDIFGKTFGGFNRLFEAFLPVGDAFLKEIDGWATSFDKFSQNKNGLDTWAKNAIPLLKDIGDIVAEVVKRVIQLGSNPQNLKDLTAVFDGLKKVIDPLFNVAQALFNLFSGFAKAAAPVVAGALTIIARALQDVANWLTNLEKSKTGMTALKGVLAALAAVVVSASLVSFVGKLLTLAGKSWSELIKVLNLIPGVNIGSAATPSQAAADTQLKAGQLQLTASENNLRAAGLMDTAIGKGTTAGGKTSGTGMWGAIGALGGILTLVFGTQAVNSGTAPNTGGRLAGNAGVDVVGGAVTGASIGGVPGAILGTIAGVMTAIFQNKSYLKNLIDTINPPNPLPPLPSGPTYLSPPGTPIDTVTGKPLGERGITGPFVNSATVTPAELGNLSTTYQSQVPSGRRPGAILPTVTNVQPGTPTRTYLQPQQQPGDPRANPSFGRGSKPILSLDGIFGPLARFFTDSIPRFFSVDIPNAAKKFGSWFTDQNKKLWGDFVKDNKQAWDSISSLARGQWDKILKPAWNAFDTNVVKPVGHWITSSLPNFFTSTVPKWWSTGSTWFMKDVGTPVSNFVTKSIPNFFTNSIPHWYSTASSWFMKSVGTPVSNFVTKSIPGFFTSTIPRWYETASSWFTKSVGTPVSNFVTKTLPGFFTSTIPRWYSIASSWFMKDVGTPVSNFITKTIPGFFTSTIPHWFDNVGTWFTKSVGTPITNFFKNLPGMIQGAFKSGINWVITNVIGTGNPASGGILGLLNKATGILGIHIPGIQPLATGGHVPGPDYVDHDSIHALLVPGEFVVRKKAAKVLGPEFLNRINHADTMKFASGGLAGPGSQFHTGLPSASIIGANPNPGSALGIDLGNIPGVKQIVGFVQGALRSGFDTLWNASVGNILKPLGTTDVPAAVANLAANTVKKSADKWLGAKDTTYAKSLGGTIPKGDQKTIIDRALQAAGIPSGLWAVWEAGLNTLITRESGWNAGAINHTDSNAAAGIPSQGLAQVIPPTFAAYHAAGTSNNILDPVANVAAAVRYILSRYGNITGVQQANANLPPKGYESGGFAMPDFGTGFAMPKSLSLASSSPSKLSQGAQGLGGRSVGLNVENLNIHNPIPEQAGESVQRQLIKHRTYGGRG